MRGRMAFQYRYLSCSGATIATCRRFQSSGRTPWRKDINPATSSVFVEESFARHTLFVLDVGKRALKFSSIGLLALGTIAAATYEGVHMWVENVGLAPETNEVRQWEWDQDFERWTSDSARGGTDPGLGLKGRHIVRAAWMAYNWGVGFSTSVVGSESAHGKGLAGPGGIKVIDARLQRTDDFLKTSISIAEKRRSDLYPQTITELVARHAAVLERLGHQFLSESKAQYDRVWAELPKQSPDAARTAMKLGDLSSRLGQSGDALAWWSRAIHLIRGGEALNSIETLPAALNSAPSSPSAQRLLSATLVSLSAFYATSGQLTQAQLIEEAGLRMLRSIRPPESLASASAPQALHALYLLQRSSVLSTHLAEVLHAQRKPAGSSIQWLTSATESSERVACVLTGQPPSSTGAPKTPESPPLPTFTSSPSMKKVAHGLLRDARRTAAEAWNLMGVLNEVQGQNAMALRCYERAVDWAGTSTDNPDSRKPADGTLESDWAVYWGNYVRMRKLAGQVET